MDPPETTRAELDKSKWDLAIILQIGVDGMGWMVIIGQWSSKSTFSANNVKELKTKSPCASWDSGFFTKRTKLQNNQTDEHNTDKRLSFETFSQACKANEELFTDQNKTNTTHKFKHKNSKKRATQNINKNNWSMNNQQKLQQISGQGYKHWRRTTCRG